MWEQGDVVPEISSVTGSSVFVDTSGAVAEILIYCEVCNDAGGAWVSLKRSLCR